MADPINFWVNQNEIVPNYILLIFVIFEIQVLVVIFILYRISIRNFVTSSKLVYGRKFFASQPPYLFPVIHLSYGGLFLLSLSSLVSHASALLTGRNAFLFVGFKNILGIVGIIVFGLSILQIRKYFVTFQQITNNVLNHRNFIIIFVIFALLISSGTIIMFVGDLSPLINVYRFVLAAIIAAMLLFIMKNLSYRYYQNEVLEIRFLLINIIYISFPIFLLSALIFVPTTTTLPENFLSRQPLVNAFIIFTSFWGLFNAIMLYLLIVFPKFLRRMMNISKEDFDIYRDESFDSADPQDIYHDINNSQEYTVNFEMEGGSYVILTDLEHKNLTKSSVLTPIVEFTEMNQVLSMESYDDTSFPDLVLKDHGIFFISTQPNPQLTDLFSKIKDHYGWNLQFSNRISYDGFEYFAENREFALLIVIPSFWDFNSKLWISVFPKSLETVMNDFFSKYLNWLDKKSNEDILFLILSFFVDDREICHPIPVDPDVDGVPDRNYVLFF